jgi:hypothetical protein
MSWTSRSWSISREEDDDEPVLYEKDVCVEHLATCSNEKYSEEWHTESAVECSKDPEPNHWTILEDVHDQPLHELEDSEDSILLTVQDQPQPYSTDCAVELEKCESTVEQSKDSIHATIWEENPVVSEVVTDEDVATDKQSDNVYICEVIYPYDAQSVGELTIKPGDLIDVREQDYNSGKEWVRGTKNWKSGLVYKAFFVPFNRGDVNPKEARIRVPIDGYRITFMETEYFVQEKPGDDLECIICKNLANDPHQTQCCGHTLCRKCMETWRAKSTSCPNCRTPILKTVMDARVRRHIASLTTYCPRYEDHCNWVGSIAKVQDHLSRECLYEVINCPNEGCKAVFNRKDRESHLKSTCLVRRIACPCCGIEEYKIPLERHGQEYEDIGNGKVQPPRALSHSPRAVTKPRSIQSKVKFPAKKNKPKRPMSSLVPQALLEPVEQIQCYPTPIVMPQFKQPLAFVSSPQKSSSPTPSQLSYKLLIEVHYKHCPSWPMRCPNHCGAEEELTRSTLRDHIDNNCPEQVISCQFAEAGCTVRVKRKEMADHIRNAVEEHMTAMMKDYIQVKKDYAELKEDHDSLKEAFEEKCDALEKKQAEMERRIEYLGY